jgi:3-oxoacyl-[acyl-carrier protein] reductase
MDLKLHGKVAIVTGASAGIGRAIALRLAAEGMDLAVTARRADRLESLAEQARALQVAVLVHAADLGVPTVPADLVAATRARFGRIDLVVNNAGATKRGDFLALTEDDWAQGFALKFFGAVRLARAAWPNLVAAHGGIVNIAGVGGRTGSAEFTIGGAVNAAMLNLTKSLADRGVRDGVRVNAINPGSIRTDRLTGRIQRLASEKGLTLDSAAKLLAEQQGIARFGEPEEIAALVAVLASDQAAYVQGSIVDIDGGWTRTL